MGTQDRRKYMLIGVLLVVPLAIFATLSFSSWRQNRRLKEELASLKAREVQARQKIKQIPRLKRQAAELSAQIDVYANILPREHEVRSEAFVETMDRFAKEAGVRIHEAEPVKKKQARGRRKGDNRPQPFQQHKYHFKLVGSFPNFLRFLHRVENWERFLAVEEIEIRPLGTTSGRGGVANAERDLAAAQEELKEIELVVTTYTYSPKKKTAQGKKS